MTITKDKSTDNTVLNQTVQSKNKAKLEPKFDFDAIKSIKEVVSIEKKLVKDFTDIELKEIVKNPKVLLKTVDDWLNQTYGIRQNEIDRQYYDFNNNALDDVKLNSIIKDAQSFFNSFSVTETLVHRCIFSDTIPIFNPFIDFYEKNKDAYSGEVGLVDKMCNTIISKTPNKNIYLKKWLVGLYGAMIGKKGRIVPLLIGEENIGKSYWFIGYEGQEGKFEGVLPKELEKYCTVSSIDTNKENDLRVLLTQKLIIVLDDAVAMNPKQSKLFKELQTATRFSCRLAFDKFSKDFKSIGTFAETSNEYDVISSESGYTRKMPIKVDKVDFKLYNSINRIDLFFEIKHLYEGGFDCKLTEKETIELKKNAVDFENISKERVLIEKYYTDTPSYKFPNTLYVNTADVMVHIYDKSKIQLSDTKKVGRELRALFGEPQSIRVNNKPVKKYSVYLRDDDNIL